MANERLQSIYRRYCVRVYVKIYVLQESIGLGLLGPNSAQKGIRTLNLGLGPAHLDPLDSPPNP